MNYYELRIFSFIITFTVLGIILLNVSAEESTRNRIQKHKEWLKRRTAEKISAGYVETNDPYQKIKYFKKLIKFKNNEAIINEISFVPHLIEMTTVIDKSQGEGEDDDKGRTNNNVDELTTVVIDTGNKFAYDTIINNNEETVFAGSNATNLGGEKSNNRARKTEMSYEVVEQSSTATYTNIINENNEKQESAMDDLNNSVKSQMESSLREHIGNTGGVDTKSHSKGNRKFELTTQSELIVSKKDAEISASIANNTSTEKSFYDFEIQRFISEHIKYKANNITIKKSWGKWSSWSSCSRTCGEGVMEQSRECNEKKYKNGKRINITTIGLNECIGFYKRFRICNEMECPETDLDFRAQQCNEFNNQSFRGQTYKWEPYIKDDAECELNCRPVNQKYFARLKEFTVDGTHCSKIYNPPRNNISYERGVCVEGKCKQIKIKVLGGDEVIYDKGPDLSGSRVQFSSCFLENKFNFPNCSQISILPNYQFRPSSLRLGDCTGSNDTFQSKAVLKNGVISGSGFMNSGNVRCGNSICRPFSGVFAKNPLPNGYVHVTTIPAGASNITITELRNSINFLSLKSASSDYIINGNYTVSQSGPYEVAGTIIDYHRFDEDLKETHHKRIDGVTEWITSSGPLFEPIHLMVLSQQINPGIKYEYLLPTSLTTSDEAAEVDYFSSAEDNLPLSNKLKAANTQINTTSTSRRKRKFAWKVIGFTECSKTCGGGSQQPIIRCVKGEPTRAYSPKKCAQMKKPLVSEGLMKCNSQPCPAFWKLSDYSSCRCGEFDEKTNQTREVKCVQELISGVVIQVNSGACVDERPLTIAQCECVKIAKTPKPEVYKPSRQQSIIQNTQSDQKTTAKNRTKPSRSKKSGSWLISEWSEQCSSKCGAGQQFRTIFCDRSPPNTERCDIRLTPNTYRECTSNVNCQGEWFIGPWSLCTGDCFNASRSRTVVCIKNDGFAEESDCDLKAKPTTFEDCKPEEMKDCKPKWHSSEWTECNKNCGSGIQRRIIECLEPDAKENILRKSSKCKYSERPTGMRYCTHDCSERTTTYDPRVDIIQNDDDPSCRDEFPNCNMVLKSKLCGYAYYNENCCQSCRKISNELF